MLGFLRRLRPSLPAPVSEASAPRPRRVRTDAEMETQVFADAPASAMPAVDFPPPAPVVLPRRPALHGAADFVSWTWEMVNAGYDDIGWSADGSRITIKKPDRLASLILPLFFRHSQYPQAGRDDGRPRKRQRPTALPATATAQGASPPSGQRPQPLRSHQPVIQRPSLGCGSAHQPAYRYASWVRALNAYHFKKVGTGQWHHPCFHRDRPELLKKIVRKPREPAARPALQG